MSCSLCIIFVSNQAKQWFLSFYFHIVPPPNRAYLRTLIHNGDLEHLEKVVLDGHGAKLMHETSALDKVSKFIKFFPLTIDNVVAVAATNVGDIQTHFDADISTNNIENRVESEKVYEKPLNFRYCVNCYNLLQTNITICEK